MPKDDTPRARRPEPPPSGWNWSSADYAWAAASVLPLLACAPFFLAVPFWVGALIAPAEAPNRTD